MNEKNKAQFQKNKALGDNMSLLHNNKIQIVNKTAIETSIFDMLKCGPGPSSSHTIAPMKAAYNFLELCNSMSNEIKAKPAKFEVRLYGSLSATGKGHGTDVAVIGGLLGNEPQKCPPHLLKEITHNPDTVRFNTLLNTQIPILLSDVIFDSIEHSYPYNNTMTIALLDESANILVKREYYSVGGGFIQWKGQEASNRGKPSFEYNSMTKLLAILEETGLTLPEVLIENEIEITGLSRKEINNGLDEIIAIMLDSVDRGLSKEGLLPGYIHYNRKAKGIYERAQKFPHAHDRFITLINAYALAVSEENADGGVIVTGPTCGAAGVLPALLYCMKNDLNMGDSALRDGLLIAVSVGFLAKHNAAIAGAEVGCQGEIGVASAMGAAMLAHCHGYNAQIASNAAEIALEHHLGMACDPVGGLVIIPCIERNAIGAMKAYNAYLLAITERSEDHKVSLDSTICAMNEIGRDMNKKFKETALGGLAVSYVNC